jgi:hypothetical protein
MVISPSATNHHFFQHFLLSELELFHKKKQRKKPKSMEHQHIIELEKHDRCITRYLKVAYQLLFHLVQQII